MSEHQVEGQPCQCAGCQDYRRIYGGTVSEVGRGYRDLERERARQRDAELARRAGSTGMSPPGDGQT